MDREKVLKALELCANGCNDDGCVYLEEQNRQGGLAKCRCVDLLTRDALDLLKEQEELIEQYKHACKSCKSRLEGVKPF